MSGADAYDRTAEFHELFMDQPWQRVRPVLRSVFGDLGAAAVIADVGAGSGAGTQVVADETSARIVALEPNATMRAMLTSRVAADADLARRLSVLAGRVPGDLRRLPARVEGVVLGHVLGHVCLADRHDLYRWLADHLAPSGAAVLTASRTPDPRPGPAEVEVRRLGEIEYRAVLTAGALGLPRSRYEVVQDGVVIRSHVEQSSFLPITQDQLIGDLDAAGLRAEMIIDGVVVARQRSSSACRTASSTT